MVKIRKVCVKNFRLLHNVVLNLEERTTVIVGRNNCGKTSLSDVIRRFLNEKDVFEIEDFSSACYDGFCAALKWKIKGAESAKIRSHIPYIELRIHFAFPLDLPLYGALSPLVIDTESESDEAIVVCRYELRDGTIDALFEGHLDVPLEGENEEIPTAARVKLFRALRERIPALFATKIFAVDPVDEDDTKEITRRDVSNALSLGFINAQRGLDGTSSRETDILARVLESLFMSASLPTADQEQRDIANGLKKAVEEIQATIDADFKNQLGKLMPTIEEFGYPGLDGPPLQTETQLDVRRLLSNHTKVQYAGYNGVELPESYNGLGFRNLLFILLRIVGFYREYRSLPQAPAVHLVVIEEPEAHLHPQMQEVFIRHLDDIVKRLCEQDGEAVTWPVQFVVSTHSSHIANEARFAAIRYFAVTSKDQPIGVRCTQIKDLRTGLSSKDPMTLEFLYQYLTLTRCDLFFADKAVSIEGTAERLIIPQAIRHLDAADNTLKLGSQYITIMEVGGAYAHLFFPLLEFLELRSLIITDLDAAKPKKNGKLEACMVHEGTTSTNACIKRWFDDVPVQDDENAEDEDIEDGGGEAAAQAGIEPAQPESEAVPVCDIADAAETVKHVADATSKLTLKAILAKTDAEKTRSTLRIAFQVPEKEGDPCGRTFEDAFILANRNLFKLEEDTNAALEEAAVRIAKKQKKSDFAMKYAIQKTVWKTPRYIADGMRWLAGGGIAALDPGLALVAQAAAAPNVAGENAPDERNGG